DEIEKADPKILDVFLQILDDGRLTDGAGDTVSFSQSLIIFTSNEGSADILRRADATPPSYEELAGQYRDAVERCFYDRLQRPELLGRIGRESIVVFDVLRPELVRSILDKFLVNVAANAKRLHGLEVTFDGSIEEACIRLQDSDLGGRAVRSFVDTQV